MNQIFNLAEIFVIGRTNKIYRQLNNCIRQEYIKNEDDFKFY